MKEIIYKHASDSYYKINTTLKKIVKIQNNVVSYPDYKENLSEVLALKSINMSEWKHIENSFFISRHFEWEFNGKKFRTTDKKIGWGVNKHGICSALVFHNGKVWYATNSGNYYPRIFLVQQTDDSKVSIKRLIYGDKPNTKWTDVKYCRHFEEY